MGDTARRCADRVPLSNARCGAQSGAFLWPNSADWKQVGNAQTIAMASAAQVGLAVTSHNDGTLCTSTITGVQVNPPPPASVSFQVNDGSAQRSMVSSIKLTFDYNKDGAINSVDYAEFRKRLLKPLI